MKRVFVESVTTYLENFDGIFFASIVDSLMELRLCYRGDEEVDGWGCWDEVCFRGRRVEVCLT